MMVMDIIIALIEATIMNIIVLMHRSTLNLGILTLLITHPLLKMSATTTLHFTASALVHLILIIIGIPIMMKDSIDPNVIRAVNSMSKVTDVGHLGLPMERRCRCSELLIVSRSGSSRNITTPIIQ